ncbi:MAG TPA: aldose 1-epimerase [Azospirillaceae bacterium]|nr:aldose 1-epimerase [Azospirillaceae bacterium]
MRIGDKEFQTVTLSQDGAEAVLLPELGGWIASWRAQGRDWLHPIHEHEGGHRGGCFALVPYSNRIENGRFTWNGRAVTLPPSPQAMPHSLHGTGWHRTWSVVDAAGGQAMLRLEHEGDADWPWRFTALMTIRLAADALTLSLRMESRDAAAQPAGLGFHPFFPRRDGVSLDMATELHWVPRPDRIPVGLEPTPPALDFQGGKPLPVGLDDCLSGWNGRARIAWTDGSALSMRADLGHALVFAPEALPYFCVEPVSHAINALNMPDRPAVVTGLRALEPGDAWEVGVEMRIGS